MKLDKTVLANASALATVLLWAICSLTVWLLPGLSMAVTAWWFHGLDIQVLGSWNLTVANFLLGGITLAGSAWITGWVFGWSWEKLS